MEWVEREFECPNCGLFTFPLIPGKAALCPSCGSAPVSRLTIRGGKFLNNPLNAVIHMTGGPAKLIASENLFDGPETVLDAEDVDVDWSDSEIRPARPREPVVDPRFHLICIPCYESRYGKPSPSGPRSEVEIEWCCLCSNRATVGVAEFGEPLLGRCLGRHPYRPR